MSWGWQHEDGEAGSGRSGQGVRSVAGPAAVALLIGLLLQAAFLLIVLRMTLMSFDLEGDVVITQRRLVLTALVGALTLAVSAGAPGSWLAGRLVRSGLPAGRARTLTLGWAVLMGVTAGLLGLLPTLYLWAVPLYVLVSGGIVLVVVGRAVRGAGRGAAG